MHEALLHTGLANRSRKSIRLSVDVRFQNPAAPKAVIGRITRLETDLIYVRCDDGDMAILAVDSSTLLRGKDGRSIPRSDLAKSDLQPGLRVLAARRETTAVVVRPL